MRKGKWLLWTLAAALLAGCSLARPEAEGRVQDRFIGFHVVRSDLAVRQDFWGDGNTDLTEYGSDSLAADGYGSFTVPRRVLMGVKDGEDYRFPGLEAGYSLYVLQETMENGNPSTWFVSDMAPSEEGLRTSVTDEGTENAVSGTIYYGPPLGDGDWDEYEDQGVWTVYRVYQTPEGTPYLDGSGNSFTSGGSYTYTETETCTRQENGRTWTDSIRVTVCVQPVPRRERLLVTQFDEANAVVRSDDMALREALPEVECEAETAWVLVEEVSKDGTVRTVYNVPEEDGDPVSHQVVLLDANGLGRTAELMIR